MFKITITKWVNGDPTMVRTIEGFESKEDGMERLRNIGHTWDYNSDFAGHLYGPDGKEVGRLNIQRFTYGVIDVEDKEE